MNYKNSVNLKQGNFLKEAYLLKQQKFKNKNLKEIKKNNTLQMEEQCYKG